MKQNIITYSECKTFGHSWGKAPASTPTSVVYGVVLRCNHCKTIRHDHFDDYFDVKRSYDYPKDYKDGVKLTKQELREAYMKQQVPVRKLRVVS
jgi:hypothetical protein